MESRRADDALYYLLHAYAIAPSDVSQPEALNYSDALRIHSSQYIESLHTAEVLARIFAVDPSDVPVDEVLRTLRLACGGTLLGVRQTLGDRRPVLNLLGGFHHAAPDRGAGFCALNDLSIAIAAVRSDGFRGQVGIIDLDFHPPDGTAECLKNDRKVWIGSISGADWGALEGVDEVCLPARTTDAVYLAALRELLSRMPMVDLALVIAGGDVLTGDHLGNFDLSLGGIAERDLCVARHLGTTPQVWVPGGGYSPHTWKIVAESGLVLAFDRLIPVESKYDPLAARMSKVARSLRPESLGSDALMSDVDLAEALGMQRPRAPRLLGFYTAEGLEYALENYRLLPMIRRLGYDRLRIEIEAGGAGDRSRLLGIDLDTGIEHSLVELEVERRQLGGGTVMFVNWLSLRNPRTQFSALRPQLPGQNVPGLGLAKEMAHLLTLMARRLHLDGVAFRPAWYHMAYAARHTGRFVDPKRQGRFLALVRDLRSISLLTATRLLAEGKVRLNAEPYTWEADEMVHWLNPPAIADETAAIAEASDRSHFTIDTSVDMSLHGA